MPGALQRRTFSVSARTLRFVKPKPSNQPSGPNPLGFVILGALSFAGLYYVAKTREADRGKHSREKRNPYPNPLIPIKKEAEQQ